MPTSFWKCRECGLVNFTADQNCKRCHASATPPSMPPAPAGIVLEDGYVMPPPPFAMGGIWRDDKTLVMTRDAQLPDKCIKCNAPAHGFKIKRKLSWHHPALYVILLAAWIIYLVLAMALSKRATVFLGLCAEHVKRRQTFLIIGWVLMALGLISSILAFANEYLGIGLLGMLLFFISIFWLAFANRVVNVKKIDDRFVYLTGIDANYLAQFPSVQGHY